MLGMGCIWQAQQESKRREAKRKAKFYAKILAKEPKPHYLTLPSPTEIGIYLTMGL